MHNVLKRKHEEKRRFLVFSRNQKVSIFSLFLPDDSEKKKKISASSLNQNHSNDLPLIIISISHCRKKRKRISLYHPPRSRSRIWAFWPNRKRRERMAKVWFFLEKVRRCLRTLFFVVAMLASLLVSSLPLLVAICDVLVPSFLLSSFTCVTCYGAKEHLTRYGFKRSLTDIPLVSVARSFLFICKINNNNNQSLACLAFDWPVLIFLVKQVSIHSRTFLPCLTVLTSELYLCAL